MKVEKDYNTIVVYIFDENYLKEKIKNIIEIILKILNDYYNFEIKDTYDIRLYTNEFYGMVLEIDKDNSTLKSKKINLSILKNTLFLYEVDDPLDYIDNEIYYYNEKYFINPKNLKLNLLENSNIIYGKDVYKVIGKGIKIL